MRPAAQRLRCSTPRTVSSATSSPPDEHVRTDPPGPARGRGARRHAQRVRERPGRESREFFQVDGRDRLEIWLSRLGRYQGMIRERLRAKGLPEDLVYLTLIESGLSNTAVSRARAVGMWQFMASTGRLYGLTV